MDVSGGACEPVGLWTTSTRDHLREMYSLYNIQPYNHNHNHGNEPIYNISATKGNRPFADGRHALAGVAIYNTQDTSIYIYIYVYIYIYKYLYNSSPGLQSAGVLGSSRPTDVIGGACEPVGRRTCTRYHLV